MTDETRREGTDAVPPEQPAATETAVTETAATDTAVTDAPATDTAAATTDTAATDTPAAPQPAAAAPAPEPPPAPAPPSALARRLRRVVPWAVALIVLAGVGSGTAFGIASLDRTDVPGLGTRSDGRWDYPALSLPALPAGAPRPFTEANQAEVHHADLRKLLIPAPRGARVDEKLDGGFVPSERYLSEYAKDQRADLRQALVDYSVRHVAARGWTMPDGTSARVYLLQFNSVAFAESFKDQELGIGVTGGAALTGAPTTELDETYEASGAVPGTTSNVYLEPKPYDERQVRQAYILAGDTLALVVQDREGEAARVPFQQTLILQNQLLG
ncbi:hypothetical protein AB0M39_12940 [Streptomyces sp. NPDC051907]|uniref:hypothetical protein n=1 Tax=Streptomyces sp. NPDC051907 TaxID=3155284 RepID=UPI003436E92E